jgi:hypothetical protein
VHRPSRPLALDGGSCGEDISAMRIRRRSRARGGLFVLVTLAAACSEDTNTLDHSLVTVVELQDLFTYTVTGLDNVSDVDPQRLWLMTGTEATVDVTSGITGGSVLLQIRGGNGEVVYLEDIADEVDTVTEANTSGIWQIDLVFEKASGEFTFTLERDTIP